MTFVTQMSPDHPEPHSESAHKRNGEKKFSSISLSQLRPFLQIAIPFFREDTAAFCGLVGIVLLTLTKAALLIFFSYVRRDMFSALNHKDGVEFYKMIVKFFGVLVVFVPIAVLYHYLRLRLALHWRKELTAKVLDKYYANRTYYIIECCKDIDNPDQRISEDLREFTSTSLDFFFILFKAVINLLSFSVVLYHICPLLFLAIILYALMGTYLTTRLGRSLVGQYYNKLLTEADFRFGLIRTRENAEGIAFYDSEATMEQVNISNLLEQVIESNLRIIYTRRNIEMFTVPYDYLVYVIPYVVLAPMYFNGNIDLGSITQGSEAFNNVRSDFSIVVDYFEKLSLFSAGIDRLSTFINRVNKGGWQAEESYMPAAQYSQSCFSVACSVCQFAGSVGRSLLSKCGVNVKVKIAEHDYVKVRDDEDDQEIAATYDPAPHTSPKEALKRSSIEFATASPHSSKAGLGSEAPPLAVDRLAAVSDIKNSNSTAPVLHCSNLTVYTPDGCRALIGAIQGDPVYSSKELEEGRDGLKERARNTVSSSKSVGVHSIGGEYAVDDRLVERGVDFEVFNGDRVLIAGPSGTGKSSLLRAISGLWELGSGRVTWNTGMEGPEGVRAPLGVFFLPQKPYNLLGSLRQQIAYPGMCPDDIQYGYGCAAFVTSVTEGDDELLGILKMVRLSTLASRMGGGDEQKGLAVHMDWSKVLSLGEQQRLAFARVLYNRKSIAVVVLDEATSALDDAAEAAMYGLLGDLSITYLSVGHRASLYKFHTKKLTLNGPGREVHCVAIS